MKKAAALVPMSDAEVGSVAYEIAKLCEDGQASSAADLKQKLQNEFMRRRGWKPSQADPRTTFFRYIRCGGILKKIADHAVAFRDDKNGLIVVSHCYFGGRRGEVEELQLIAEKHHMDLEIPTDYPSWYFPYVTTMQVWRRRESNAIDWDHETGHLGFYASELLENRSIEKEDARRLGWACARLLYMSHARPEIRCNTRRIDEADAAAGIIREMKKKYKRT